MYALAKKRPLPFVNKGAIIPTISGEVLPETPTLRLICRLISLVRAKE
jgi:hypothetical protein